MAQYTTTTSDKTRSMALRRLLLGGIGLHLFYVGRIGSGLLRAALGALLWALLITGIKDGETAMLVTGIAGIIVINAPDFFKIILGKFQDNTGAYLRQ